MNIYELNKAAWDREVDEGENPYTRPVSPEVIAKARGGRWEVYLSDCKPTPREWFPLNMHKLKVLCLASGGGQQVPVLAAAGAQVTSFDASPRQLAQDRLVAERDGLAIETVEGDMADLSVFEDSSFDLIFNPASTIFVPDLEPVWRECARVLHSGGFLLTGFLNPDEFIFDPDALDYEEKFVVKYPLPYVEHETLSEEELERRMRDGEMFHFSHSMDAQLGGLIRAGFVITGFFEDRRPEQDGNPICRYMPSYYVVRAQKIRFSV